MSERPPSHLASAERKNSIEALMRRQDAQLERSMRRFYKLQLTLAILMLTASLAMIFVEGLESHFVWIAALMIGFAVFIWLRLKRSQIAGAGDSAEPTLPNEGVKTDGTVGSR